MRISEAKRIIERIDVIKAYIDGESIQYKHNTSSTWLTFKLDNPGISSDDCEWRIAPEPREFWVAVSKVGIPQSVRKERAFLLTTDERHGCELIKVREVIE